MGIEEVWVWKVEEGVGLVIEGAGAQVGRW